MKRAFLTLFLLVFAEAVWGGGIVSGRVTYQGISPLPKKRPITVDSESCGREALSEGLLVGKKGGIKNGVLYLKGPIEGAKPFPTPAGGFVIDQVKCRFDPHVRIVAAGAPLEVLNTDRILHTFHTLSRLNPEMNKAQPKSLPKMTLTFDRPEIFEVRCDVHDWMRGWVVVAEHPYYVVTDDEGAFRLTDVPAGDYTLTLWHESLGTKARRIRVKEGEETGSDFKLWRLPKTPE